MNTLVKMISPATKMTTTEFRHYFDVTPLMTPDITGVGVYTKELFFSLKEIGCSLKPVYKLSRFSKRKHIKTHISQDAKAYIPLFHQSGLLHGTDFKLLTSSSKIKKVLTIHDLAVYREDLLDSQFCRLGQEKIEKEIEKNPEAIIVPTEFVKEELVTRFPSLVEKTFAIHHGCDHLPSQDREQDEGEVGSKYFLYVGRLEKRKNVSGLIEAFNLFCEKKEDVNLIIVGSEGFGAKEIKEKAQSSVCRQRIIFKGYVDNERLKTLYQNAMAFVYPSLYEGFGIPLIEAMRMSIPVLTSSFGAMKEVGGEGALLVDTLDGPSFAHALLNLATSEELRQQLICRGYNRSLEFTWEQTAEQTLAVYNTIIDPFRSVDS